MEERYIQCPYCKHTSKDKLWDMQTKERLGVHEDDPDYIPAREAKESEYDPFYFCPMCEHQVEGVEFLMDGDIIPDQK